MSTKIKHILIIRGRSQYAATGRFLDEIMSELQNAEIQTDLLDSYDEEAFYTQRAKLKYQKYDVILSINGMALEPDSSLGKTLLKSNTIYCTILVDHPYVHHERICNSYPYILILCPDANHVDYLERYYPNIWCEGFLAHGGCKSKIDIPYEKKSIPISFMGSYHSPEEIWNSFGQYPKEMQKLMQNTAQTLIANPQLTLEGSLLMQFQNIGIQGQIPDFASICAEFRIVDTFIRSYYRDKVIRTIAEADIPIDIYGDGWEKMNVSKRNCLQLHPRVEFTKSLEIVADSKINLNIMPWFKAGSHERVFSAMLCGSVCLTDPSLYLANECINNENIAFYELEHLDTLPEKIDTLLTDTAYASRVAANGKLLATKKHTWAHRGKELLDYLQTVQNLLNK